MQAPRVQLDIAYHVPHVRDDSKRFYAASEWVARQFGVSHLSVSIAIVDDPTIQQLNREHLDHDWPTDVISFIIERTAERVDGEVIASADTAESICVEAGWSREDELLLYIVHGLLHIAGLDDIAEDERQQMRLAEQACLRQLGVAAAENYLLRWDDVSY
jgi:probable rRNA maturation factor